MSHFTIHEDEDFHIEQIPYEGSHPSMNTFGIYSYRESKSFIENPKILLMTTFIVYKKNVRQRN